MMRSESFETQQVREIGREEAEKSRLSHLMDGVFQMEGKESKAQDAKIENVKKIHARRGRSLSMGLETNRIL